MFTLKLYCICYVLILYKYFTLFSRTVHQTALVNLRLSLKSNFLEKKLYNTSEKKIAFPPHFFLYMLHRHQTIIKLQNLPKVNEDYTMDDYFKQFVTTFMSSGDFCAF